MTCLSARATTLRRSAGATLLAVVLSILDPAALVWADDTATPAPTLTSSPNPTTTMGSTATSLSGLTAPVYGLNAPVYGLNAPAYGFGAPVYDFVTSVESIDGTEVQRDTKTKRTVILDSKVLFPEDRATLSSAARGRLRSVARQIRQSSASGTVRVDGYTDDQGSARHGLVLSRQRAKAVRKVLAPLLAGTGVRFETRGLGEANPRFPNADKSGRPIRKNQAKNRRVEITFSRAG